MSPGSTSRTRLISSVTRDTLSMIFPPLWVRMRFEYFPMNSHTSVRTA